MVILWWLIFAVITWFLPRRLKLIAFLINLFLPDPIPYLDELIILVGYLRDVVEAGKKKKAKT
ncbi:MAG: DUF6116 family protein [Bacillota bacterium]